MSDHAARMNGKVKGIALSGKAGETWERIFGGEPAGPLTEETLLEAIEYVYEDKGNDAPAVFPPGLVR